MRPKPKVIKRFGGWFVLTPAFGFAAPHLYACVSWRHAMQRATRQPQVSGGGTGCFELSEWRDA